MTKQITTTPRTVVGTMLPPVPKQTKALVAAIKKLSTAQDKAANSIVAFYGAQWTVGHILADVKKDARPEGKPAKGETRPSFQSLLDTMKPQLESVGFTATSEKSALRYIHLASSHQTAASFMTQFNDWSIDVDGRFPGIRDLGTSAAKGRVTYVKEQREERAAQHESEQKRIRQRAEEKVQAKPVFQKAVTQEARDALIKDEVQKERIKADALTAISKARKAGVTLPKVSATKTAPMPTYEGIVSQLRQLKDAGERAILVHIKNELNEILNAGQPVSAPLDLPKPTPAKRTPRKRTVRKTA